MKERQILFSGPMVRALLAGTKTQTRRVMKLPSIIAAEPDGESAAELNGLTTVEWLSEHEGGPGFYGWMTEHPEEGSIPMRCPYGQPGDRLWVRETWMPDAPRDGTWADTAFYGCGMSPLSEIPERFRKPEHCLHRATWSGSDLVGWKPSIHMPRWASRITLEITAVRVERLQDISVGDAIAEGIPRGGPENPDGIEQREYRELWESINGPGSWALNPWVWVISFHRVEKKHGSS